MAWDFSTDPEWAKQLAWVEEFVRSECEPIDLIVKESHDLHDPCKRRGRSTNTTTTRPFARTSRR